jgi:hypothetical protein
MGTIFPWIISLAIVVSLCIIGLIVDNITKKR